MAGDGRTTIAVLTDLWPSASEPTVGVFVRAQVSALSDRWRHVVLVPRLVLPGLHSRVWEAPPQGWQSGYRDAPPSGRLLRYPLVRVPKVGEAPSRALGARLALARGRERPSIVHGHFLHEVGAAAVRVAHMLGVPAVVTVHGTDARWLLNGDVQERHRRGMLEALRRADRILVVERDLAAGLAEAARLPEGRVEVVPMGVDETVFRPRSRREARQELGLDPDRPLVVFVGRATALKGIDVLDRALAEVEADCVAVGSPGAAARIRFVGAEPPERVALWLAAADLFCLPSLAEGMPVSVMEALACGRPVVASAVGGIPEQLAGGQAGLLVPAGDGRALAGALRAALSRVWDEGAIRTASERFWWSRLAPRIAATYEELLERPALSDPAGSTGISAR